jgi:hypothetical protein
MTAPHEGQSQKKTQAVVGISSTACARHSGHVTMLVMLPNLPRHADKDPGRRGAAGSDLHRGMLACSTGAHRGRPSKHPGSSIAHRSPAKGCLGYTRRCHLVLPWGHGHGAGTGSDSWSNRLVRIREVNRRPRCRPGRRVGTRMRLPSQGRGEPPAPGLVSRARDRSARAALHSSRDCSVIRRASCRRATERAIRTSPGGGLEGSATLDPEPRGNGRPWQVTL